MKIRYIVLFVALTVLAAAQVVADCEAPHSFVVVFDLRSIDAANDEFGEPRPRVYSFSVASDRKLANDITMRAPWDTIAARLQAHGTSTRWIAARGGNVEVSAYGSRDQIEEVHFNFTEKPRLTRLGQDIVDLIRIAREISVAAVDRSESAERIWRQCHALNLPRAELTVKAVAAKAADKAEKPEGGEKKKEEGSASARVTYWPGVFSTKVTTGPREGLYLSADVPLTKASQLKLNDAGTDVQLGNEPGAFYVGANYTLGDALSEPTGLLDRFVIKGMLKAGRNPSDSYGWAIGVRSIDIPWLGIHLDTITPFAGYTYTRQATPKGQPSRGRNSELRFGVSVNLSSAVKWVKHDDTKK